MSVWRFAHYREAPHAVALTLLERHFLTMIYLTLLNAFVNFICGGHVLSSVIEHYSRNLKIFPDGCKSTEGSVVIEEKHDGRLRTGKLR